MKTPRRRRNPFNLSHLEALESRLMLTIDIQFDYTTLGDAAFFTTERRNAMNSAAAIFESRITNSLAAIPASSGQLNRWQPAPPAAISGAVTLPARSIPANTIIIYMGAENYSGNTAGRGGSGLLINSFEVSNVSGTNTVTQNGIDWIELLLHRGNGVNEYSTWGGAIYFDSSDRDWYAGISPEGISDGQTDLIATAQHEIAHVLGYTTTNLYSAIGSANPTLNMGALRNREYGWPVHANGNSFSGPRSRTAWDGSGNVPINGTHWLDSITSDGVETLMDSEGDRGTSFRKQLTSLDWAGLDDIGWDVVYPPSLSLRVNGSTTSPITITETNSDFTIPAVITRSALGGSLAGNFVVTLSSSDTGALTVPATVTIPNNQASVTFNVTIKADADFDDELATITAFSSGATNGAQVFDVSITDDETPELTWVISPTTVDESPNDTTISNVRITKTGPTSTTATVVTLTSPDTTELSFAGAATLTVTIPANSSTSEVFAIKVEDDDIFDGDKTIQLKAAASGFADSLQPVVVRDNELPTLAITSPAALTEGADYVNVTVARNTTEGVANVTLSGTPAAEIEIEDATLQIADGQSNVVFRVRAKDDAVFDGSIAVELRAAAPLNNAATKTVNVVDNEVPELTWTISPTTVTESVAGTTISNVRINRTGPVVSTATVVTVTSPDTTELSFDGSASLTVTIPADSTSSEAFSITVVDDTVFDGTKTVALKAAAAGFTDSLQNVDVRDNELPSLTVSTLANLTEGVDFVDVTVSRNTNTGIANVTLSADPANQVDVETATLQIPDGSTSVVFRVRATDNAVFDGTVDVVLTAAAAGNNSGSRNIQTLDNEVPALAVSVSPTSFSEGAGTAAAQATVTRTGPTDLVRNVIVQLSGKVTTAQATVTIPAGSSSVVFDLDAVDDAIFGTIESRNAEITVSAAWASNAPVASFIVSENEQASPIDIDQDGVFSSLTDGIAALRYIAGFQGNSLTDGVVNSEGDRTNGAAISAALDNLATLDVDGNGQVNTLTDGILLLRYFAGFTGSTLTEQAVGSGATRTTAAQIIAFLDAERNNTPGPSASATPSAFPTFRSRFERSEDRDSTELPLRQLLATTDFFGDSVQSEVSRGASAANFRAESSLPSYRYTADTDQPVSGADEVFTIPDVLADILGSV